jgi:hypothetical protein
MRHVILFRVGKDRKERNDGKGPEKKTIANDQQGSSTIGKERALFEAIMP